MDGSVFDEDYYEHGIESGKSLYQNYRWMPEATMSMAMAIIDYLHIRPRDSVFEIGCAKGYLIKALHLLHRKSACGVDISPYAIDNIDPAVEGSCWLIRRADDMVRGSSGLDFDMCIAKDVFEHIEEDEIGSYLHCVPAKRIFVCVPLGDGDNGFRAKPNNLDVTHVTCKPEQWWHQKFESYGWRVYTFTFRVDGIKESYYKRYPEGHGFFVLDKI